MPKRCEAPLPEKGRLRRRIGLSVKVSREMADLSQTEVAKLLGWGDRTTISNYETGKREMMPAQMCRIASLLGVTPGTFLNPAITALEDHELEETVRDDMLFSRRVMQCTEKLRDREARMRFLASLEAEVQRTVYPRNKPPFQ
ncbi:MAG: helix-turn-helix transcriptional regulator [Pseudomonadota bacterium]